MAVIHGQLNSDLERCLNVFGIKYLRRIMRYYWNYFVSNQQLLHETVSSIVCESQLRLYGDVARLPDVHPAHRVLSVRDNPWWKTPRERARKS